MHNRHFVIEIYLKFNHLGSRIRQLDCQKYFKIFNLIFKYKHSIYVKVALLSAVFITQLYYENKTTIIVEISMVIAVIIIKTVSSIHSSLGGNSKKLKYENKFLALCTQDNNCIWSACEPKSLKRRVNLLENLSTISFGYTSSQINLST